MGKPYLGDLRDDIHKYDGDTNPSSKSENEADRSDPALEAESFTKGKQQAESSSEDKVDQQICNSPVLIQPLHEVPTL